MAGGHLWWALAGDQIDVTAPGVDDMMRWRSTQSGWHKTSLKGDALDLQTLSSALTQTASYRRTICKVAAEDYLLRRIRGNEDPLFKQANALQSQLVAVVDKMVRALHWEEFETLIDLIFIRNGWRRTSLLGGNMPDVDLILEQPITGETTWVQVKTGSSQSELLDYVQRFQTNGCFDRFVFACASPRDELHLSDYHAGKLAIWTGSALAERAISSGLLDWLTTRSR